MASKGARISLSSLHYYYYVDERRLTTDSSSRTPHQQQQYEGLHQLLAVNHQRRRPKKGRVKGFAAAALGFLVYDEEL